MSSIDAEFMQVFDLFFGFGSLATSGFFYFIYTLVKARQASFVNAIPYEGVVVELNPRLYPVIEYQRDGKTYQFTSQINAPGARVGQRIDLEISPQGVARIKSSGHAAIRKGLLVTSIAFFVVACVFLIKRYV